MVPANTEALLSAASAVTVCKGSAAGGGSGGNGSGGGGGGSGGRGGNKPVMARGCGVDKETSERSGFSSACGLPAVAFRLQAFLFGGIIVVQWTRAKI